MNLHLLSRILAQPWALRREHLATLTQLVIGGREPQRPKFGQRADAAPTLTPSAASTRKVWTWDGQIEIAAQPGYEAFNSEGWMASDRSALPPCPAGVTVFLVWGILGRAWSETDRWWLDAIDVDDLTASLLATPENSTIVLWFRSPGGISSGIPETAELLRSIAGSRRILAFTDDLCASAAYWLAAQAESIHATPTAYLGSIGVYIAFYDWCEYLKKAGIKLELFKAGEMKGMGLPGNPLSDKEAAHLQALVIKTYDAFTADVTRNRAIATEHMQGQTLSGSAALAAKLVDSFHPSAASFFAALGR